MRSSLEAPAVDKLASEILEARLTHLKSRIRPQDKRDYMYLSDVHACTRHNFYSMAEGDKRKPMDEFVQARMEAGEIWEPKIISQLTDMGFQWVEGQVRVEIKNRSGEKIGSGKIDGKIAYGGRRFPCEIKNLSENVFRRIQSVEDLFKTEWTEKYLRQLLLYMYGHNEEQGLFIITDRGGLWRVIPIYLGNHLDYAERVLKNMEAAFEAKKIGQAPDRIPYQHRLCGPCQFATVCQPTTVIEGGEVLEDPEIAAMLEQHELLKAKADDYKEIHESVKALFQGKPETTVNGRFIVKPKKSSRASYDTKLLDPKVRESIKKMTESWSVDIEDVQAKPEESHV